MDGSHQQSTRDRVCVEELHTRLKYKFVRTDMASHLTLAYVALQPSELVVHRDER
jgi:hypothetical protein